MPKKPDRSQVSSVRQAVERYEKGNKTQQNFEVLGRALRIAFATDLPGIDAFSYKNYFEDLAVKVRQIVHTETGDKKSVHSYCKVYHKLNGSKSDMARVLAQHCEDASQDLSHRELAKQSRGQLQNVHYKNWIEGQACIFKSEVLDEVRASEASMPMSASN